LNRPSNPGVVARNLNILENKLKDSQNNTHFLAIGGLIYTGVSTLWVIIAYVFGDPLTFAMIIAIILLLGLGSVSTVTLRSAVKKSPISSGSPELGKWFGIIFAAEGMSIGIGSGILAGLERFELIAPLVALIVGLHFFPLGYLLRLRSDFVLGAAILILVAVTVFALPPERWINPLSLGTAFLLWSAGLGRVFFARKYLQRLG
jgi:hypothetical protein